ncbi:MAG: hypothetical protein HC886_00325 [Leptolyngbyaceae cyanobacterium SM1_1_3]|nr:hypothetical protein [Leptolyngbyaceae cyanobacterium SM1_1_3]
MDRQQLCGRSRAGSGLFRGAQGQKTYLDSEFAISSDWFRSWDRGRDPDTHEQRLGGASRPVSVRTWAKFRP